MGWRITTALGLMILVCLLIAAPSPLFAASSAPENAYRSAEDCLAQVKKDPEARNSRYHWKKCLAQFKRVAQKYAAAPVADDAAYQTAAIYEILYKRFRGEGDRLEAVSWFDRVVREYPKSPLAGKSRSAFKRLNAVSGEILPAKAAGNAAPVLSDPEPSRNESRPAGGIVQGIRHRTEKEYTRVVIDLSSPASYKNQLLEAPLRLSIDLQARLPEELPPLPVEDGIVREVVAGQFDSGTVRVVIGLTQAENYKIYPLTNPDRLVIDLSANLNAGAGGSASPNAGIIVPPPVSAPPFGTLPLGMDDIRTIVVDPGHGGEDPGAIGRNGLQEKNVVLDVGLRLKELLETRLGKKVIMTRDRDVFIPLKERTEMANRQGADLFLSVHANASPRKEARGIETYLLGRPSSQEAMLTALRENGISPETSTGDLETILTDLLNTVKKEESLRFAHYVQDSLVGALHPNYPVVDLGVKQAPFYVLVNAAMPSILAEISFVSNPEEEKRLGDPAYRQQVAEALLAGVERYVSTAKYAARGNPLSPDDP